MRKGSDNDLPSGVIAALPKDPNQQLAVAHQITEYAFSGRAEAETASLRIKVAEQDALIAKLLKDKDMLSGQLKNAMGQVSELDEFKNALMKSLEVNAESGDDGKGERPPCSPDPPCGPGAERKSSKPLCPPDPPSLCGAGAAAAERKPPCPPSKKKEGQGPYSCRKCIQYPETPRDSPCPPTDDGPCAEPVDGKEFFRLARTRLSYEKFSEFLTQVKELNANRQSREETKQKSTQIFGPDNCDLTEKFADLLSRYVIPLPPPA